MLGITEDIIDEVLREKTAHEQIVEALLDLIDEAPNSVEYSDWPELQEAVEKAEKALTLLETHTVCPNTVTAEDGFKYKMIGEIQNDGGVDVSWSNIKECHKLMIQTVRGK